MDKHSLTINARKIPFPREHWYLAMTTDRVLTWTERINHLKTKLLRFVLLICFVSGTTWGTTVPLCYSYTKHRSLGFCVTVSQSWNFSGTSSQRFTCFPGPAELFICRGIHGWVPSVTYTCTSSSRNSAPSARKWPSSQALRTMLRSFQGFSTPFLTSLWRLLHCNIGRDSAELPRELFSIPPFPPFVE